MSKTYIAQEINEWEKQLASNQPSDLRILYDKWLNQILLKMSPTAKRELFSKIDNVLFHVHAYLQGSSVQKEKRKEIITTSRVFAENIRIIEDLHQLSIDELTFLAQQQISKTKWTSLLQGGLTGSVGFLLLGVDFPLLIVINMRIVQTIGLTFGYEINKPFEMMIALKVFHAATLPKRYQKNAWQNLLQELHGNYSYIYEGKEDITDYRWLNQPLKQLVKSLVISVFRKKVLQGIPVISIGVGAYANYHLTKQVTEYALRFYQKRYLLEK